MSADETVGRWIDLELAPWRGFLLGGRRLAELLRAEAEAKPSVFLFHVDGAEVTFDDKATGYASPPVSHHRDVMIVRAQLYRSFFEDALRLTDNRRRGTFAFELEDIGKQRFPVPVFAFQKRRGANSVLLPDPDFLGEGFYEAPAFADALSFDAKRPRAMFVGSTTGDPLLTAAMVRAQSNNRLRAAVFFKDQDDVTFDLPNVVQYDFLETRDLILGLGVTGRSRTWQEQLENRYILSLDGNGATCSRVLLTLLSNSVLLKYQSPYLLYYFHDLVPWIHFVPIMRDQDVLDLLRARTLHEATHRDIAAQSQAFARRHLTRELVMRYAGGLLTRYFNRFFG